MAPRKAGKRTGHVYRAPAGSSKRLVAKIPQPGGGCKTVAFGAKGGRTYADGASAATKTAWKKRHAGDRNGYDKPGDLADKALWTSRRDFSKPFSFTIDGHRMRYTPTTAPKGCPDDMKKGKGKGKGSK